MNGDEIEKYTQKIREAKLTGDNELYKKLMFETYECCFNYYLLACNTLRKTKDSKLIDMIIGMRNSLDSLGRVYTEHIEEMNFMN